MDRPRRRAEGVYAALVPLTVVLGMRAPEFFQGFGRAARIPCW
jgi:hypothetical protein